MTKTLEDKIEELLHTREGRHFPEVAKDLGKLFKSEMKKIVPKELPQKIGWNWSVEYNSWNSCREEILDNLRKLK